MPSLAGVPRFIPLTQNLATAGQPSQEQLAAIAKAGFEVLINLGLHDDPDYSLPDEAGSARALGLAYVHIPVQFASPRLEDLAQFSAAMAKVDGRRVFVHCRHNKRVPVFVALDRVLRQRWNREEAFAVMRETWSPNARWQDFIDEALAKG